MVIETLATAIAAFISLISAAFTKIMIMFLTVLMIFFFIPQSRAASMLAVAIISSFIGGTIIHLLSMHASWSLVVAISISFGAGLMVFPFLMIFSKFYKLMSEDKELHETIYVSIKDYLLDKVTRYLKVDKVSKK